MSSFAKMLNVEAHEFSPLTAMKLEVAMMSNEKEMLRKSKAQGPRSKSVDRLGYSSELMQKAKILEGKLEWRQQSTNEYCRFCRSNGEKHELYSTHVTKGPDGSVQCPVLRDYICPK